MGSIVGALIFTNLILLPKYCSATDAQSPLENIFKSNVIRRHSVDHRSPCYLELVGQWHLDPGFETALHRSTIQNDIPQVVKTAHIKFKRFVQKHQTHCTNVLVLPNPVKKDFLSTVSSSSESVHQESLHFILINSFNILAKIWSTSIVTRIKRKTGLLTDPRSSSIFISNVRGDHDSQQWFLTETLPTPSFGWSSLRNEHLRVGIFKLDVHVIFDSAGSPKFGFSYSCLEALAKARNFTHDLEIKYTGFGQNPDGTWQGMLGDLVNRKKDILFIMGQTLQRNEAIDFTTPYAITTMRFFTRRPTASIKWEAIFYPFDLRTWNLILFVFVLMTPVFYLHLKFGGAPHRSKQEDPWYHAITLPFSALIQESINIPPRVHFLMQICLLYSMIIQGFYSSNLISFLTFPEPEPVPLTYEDLALRKDYTAELMVFNGGATEVLFNKTKVQHFVEIRKRLLMEKNFNKCVRDAILNKKTVCISWPIMVDNIMAKNFTLNPNLNLALVSSSGMFAFINIGLQRYSKHTESLSSAIGWLANTGHGLRWKDNVISYLKSEGRRWLVQEKGEIYRNITELANMFEVQTKPFGIYHFVVSFFVVQFGASAGLFALFGEILGTKLGLQVCRV
ncbi:unnamed protein product [Allacma fusca]|uniref:Ionotropic glutamate receptor L-glutamate and glycine-binding domain-containing protein n=1 Tax=Allacma fusca TaxID=39272 RepID=A0A8J2NQD1_9HEXA|nr:unnamed protein product [Allacma fusca]